MSIRSRILACALPLAALASVPAFAADNVFAIAGVPSGVRLAPMADAAPMRVIVTLPLRNEAAARAYGEAVSNPKSPLYGRYLSPAEFGARFGADPAAYEAIRGWAKSAGLSVGPRLDSRAEISLGGTAAQFAAIFGTHFQTFTTAERGLGYTVTDAPKLPAVFAGRVSAVVGLTSAGQKAVLPHVLVKHTDVGTGINGSGYAPADLKAAYDVPKQKGKATEVVALFEQCGFRASDLSTFIKAYKLPTTVKTQEISVNGSPTGELNGAEVEADLDLDMLVGGNPKIQQILVYEDSYNHDSFQTAILDTINQIAQDKKATVWSVSYGQDESMQGTAAVKAEGAALVQLQTEGISVLISSGDQGAVGRTGSGLHAPDPGSQPLVTSVGGTTLTTNPSNQAYVSETVWNNFAQGYPYATGGGVSAVWKIPSYQVVNGKSVAAANGGSSKKRNVPDVAADADIFTPLSVYSQDGGGWIGIGGTSASTPIWASWISIFNAERAAAGKARLGFLNPLIYTVGEAGGITHDITQGYNNKTASLPYHAGTGYDNCTGWGSLDVTKDAASFLK